MNLPVVLLVDDEPAVVEGLELRLRSKKYQVRTATSAAQALEMMAEQPVDIVVSDERMPGMPGSEFLTVVAHSFPETSRVILTGQASVEAAMKAINDAKVAHYLTKPCDVKKLKALIDELLAQQIAQSAPVPTRADGQLALLERIHPGIAEVKRDESGAIVLDD